MAFGRNGMGPCGKRAKWSLGEMGKLGEIASGRNEKWVIRIWAKRQNGRTDIGRNGKMAKLERAKTEWAKREKIQVKWEWAKWDWANWE